MDCAASNEKCIHYIELSLAQHSTIITHLRREHICDANDVIFDWIQLTLQTPRKISHANKLNNLEHNIELVMIRMNALLENSENL